MSPHDRLPSVMSDDGPREAVPVVLFDCEGKYAGQFGNVSLGYEQIALPVGSAVAFGNVPEGARVALVRIEGAPARYRDDGTLPTATVGMPLDDGEALVYDARLADVKLTAQSPGAIANVTYYG